jgi:hypothetical protein
VKAIALVVIEDGCAVAYAPDHVDVRIIDLDGMKSDPAPYALPAQVGFEELAVKAKVRKHVVFEL